VKDFLRNAFAVDDGKPCEPTEAQRAILEKLTREVAERRLTGPAVAFLEMSRPLNGLGAAVIQFFTPIAATLANPESLRDFAEFLEKRGSVDYLCRMPESAEAARSGGCCEGSPADDEVPAPSVDERHDQGR
jgi:hypothetical protein